MATQRQINANRLNALKSTGPRTLEGKRASSQNALKSGLDADSQFVLGESREEFALLQAEWHDYVRPTNPEERFQVDNIIRNEWLLRRFHRVEGQLWEYHTMQADRSSGVQLGEAFSKATPTFMRLQRRITAAEKACKEAKAELYRLREVPQPEQTKPETEQSGSFLTPSPKESDDAFLARIEQAMNAPIPTAQPSRKLP